MEESVFGEIGEVKGEMKGERDALLRVGARRLGPVTPSVQESITRISSLEKLQAMLDRVLGAQSWDELFQAA